MSALEGVYLATLGGARALDLDKHIGNFEMGKEADFVVLNKVQEGLTGRRLSRAGSVAESLFALMTLGDDRAVRETRILGQLASSP